MTTGSAINQVFLLRLNTTQRYTTNITIRYDTIEEINVDSKAEYTA